jgi:hypothetical protein
MAEPARDPAALAAKTVYDLLVQHLRDDRGVHAETALCAAGAIVGDAIAAGGGPAHELIARVLTYVRDRCTILNVALPPTDDAPPDAAEAPHRDAQSLAAELRDGVVDVLRDMRVAQDDAPFVIARCIPALLSNTAAVLDARVGYGIAVHALRATAGQPHAPSPACSQEN